MDDSEGSATVNILSATELYIWSYKDNFFVMYILSQLKKRKLGNRKKEKKSRPGPRKYGELYHFK